MQYIYIFIVMIWDSAIMFWDIGGYLAHFIKEGYLWKVFGLFWYLLMQEVLANSLNPLLDCTLLVWGLCVRHVFYRIPSSSRMLLKDFERMNLFESLHVDVVFEKTNRSWGPSNDSKGMKTKSENNASPIVSCISYKSKIILYGLSSIMSW